ncbi:MAG: FHA domain-containing protein [Acidimicrobiia bacterium]
MSEAVLTVLKFCFLALLYLFLARVVRVVVLELRNPPAAEVAGAPSAAPPPRPRREKRIEARGALRLRILEPSSRKGEVLPIPEEVTVGRGGGCGIVLADDTYVSTLHARLFQRNRESFVEDLGSTNGTFVNGKRVSHATRLRRGDQVQFGQTVAEVVR